MEQRPRNLILPLNSNYKKNIARQPRKSREYKTVLVVQNIYMAVTFYTIMFGGGQGLTGHWAVYYTSPKSFTLTFSPLLA